MVWAWGTGMRPGTDVHPDADPDSPLNSGPSRPWLRPLLWLLGWLLLAVPIARVQLAEVALADHRPAQALLFDAGHARALATLAGALQLKGQQQDAITLAREALKHEPMNVTALRTLGLALEQTGDTAAANRIMFLAGGLGWRDVALQLWLIKGYALSGDNSAALRRADALARTNHLPEITFPVFLASITDADLRWALVHEMADRPFWRGNFFYRLLQLPADQTPYIDALIADLARAGSPINPGERAIYLTRLVQVGQGPAAYAYWLRDQRAAGLRTSTLPWDGGFDHVPPPATLAAPFEWRITPESTGVAGIVASPAGSRQLSVSSGRDYTGTLISQTMALQPGRYRLTARVQGDATASGLHWTLRCAPGQRELGVDTGREGTDFAAASFEIPADCDAQTLSIDMASSGDMGGDVTIDDVSIRRIG